MNEPKIFDSLDDFEKDWEKHLEELNKDLEEVEPISDETDTDDDEVTDIDDTEILEDEQDEDDDEDDTEDELETTEVTPKVDKADKAAHKFKQLREEAKREKERADALTKERQEMEDLALSLGYNSYDEFKKVAAQKRLEEEAKRQGKDPEVYREIQELKKQLAKQEEERIRLEKERASQKAINTMGEFIKENDLTEEEFSKVLDLAAKDGYNDINDFTQVKGLKTYFKGLSTDLLFEKRKQKEIQKEQKKKKLTTKPHNNTTATSTGGKSIREIAEEEVYREYGIKR